MDETYKKMIGDEFASCVRNTISRLDNAETHRPFHEALRCNGQGQCLDNQPSERRGSRSLAVKTWYKKVVQMGGAKPPVCTTNENTLNLNLRVCENVLAGQGLTFTFG